MAGNKKLEIIVQEFITPKKHFMSNTRFVILILLLPISGYCIIREVKQKNFFLRSAAVLFLFVFTYLFSIEKSYSQSVVNVNNLTGTANTTIPVYHVSVGDLSSPVSLSNTSSGLKVEDYDNSCGLGWHLYAGGSVTREVKDFPDDIEYQGDVNYNIIKGWLRPSNTAPQTLQTLTINNTGSGNCGNEYADASALTANFPYSYDVEPDIFSVHAPGLYCSFVFDATSQHVIKTIPYNNYKIDYTSDATGKIIAFTITNENGIKYYFDLPNLVQHAIDLFIPGPYTPPNDPSLLEAYKRNFLKYRAKFDYAGNATGALVSYNDEWTLTKMEDTRGNKILYNYETYTYQNPEILKRTTHKDIEILKPTGNGTFTKKKIYGVTKTSNSARLLNISIYAPGSDVGILPCISFSWAVPPLSTDEDKKLLSISLPIEKKTFELSYTTKFKATNIWNGFGRYFLEGIKVYGNNCTNVNTQYDFTYYNVNEADHTCYCTPVNLTNNQLVDTIINAQDYWGYYNGRYMNTSLQPQIYVYPDNPAVELFKTYPIPGYTGSSVTISSTNNRNVTIDAIGGSLKKITYPTGAVTELEYDNNEFFDKDVNGTVPGGGIRIRKITNNDGLNTTDITYYDYNDPANPGLTTGRAISVPKFAFAFPNNTNYSTISDRVKNSIYLTADDVNNKPQEILYGKVTVRKTGVGKTIYEYNTSGTFGSLPAADWDETKNFVARTNLSSPSNCPAIQPGFLYVNNGNLQYPFATNANYDFERGLLTKITHKNEADEIVATEDYTYDRSHQNPTKIYGLTLDELGNSMLAYGKYGLNTAVDNFLVSKLSTLYNSPGAAPITSVENYTYTPKNSALPYRLLKEVSKQNSDGATLISRFKYAKEYAATGTGDDMDKAIFNFNTNNNNQLIEKSQHRLDGSAEKTIGASLNTFKGFTLGDFGPFTAFLPSASFQFINQSGITNFIPSNLSGGVFTKDNNYVNTPATIQQYTSTGLPYVINDNSRIPKTILSTPGALSIKVAEFTNANPEHVGYSDFDNEAPCRFTLGTNTVVSGGRYSNNYLNFQPNTTICRTLTKHAAANNLIVSFWLKDAASIGSIYFCFSKLCGSVCNTNAIVNFTRGSQWKYYQVTVPWGGSLTTLSYSLATSAAVKIDNVLIYPDNASVTTYSYTTNTTGTNLLTAKTGINGIGNSYEYDNAGRLWLVRDQFENILEVKKYKLANRHPSQIPSIFIGYNYQHYTVNQPGDFNASLPYTYDPGDCQAPPVSYLWNFGDGTAGLVSTGDPNNKGFTQVQHTYTTEGKYVVTVTASSPSMTDIVAQTPPVTNVYPNPLPVQVDAVPPPCSPGTPQICAAGIIQLTSANQCILANCAGLPTPACNITNFRVNDVIGGALSSVYAVQWEKAAEGSNFWSTWQPEIAGTAGFNTSHAFHVVHTNSYQMRARVKFCNVNGSIAYSNIILVKNGD